LEHAAVKLAAKGCDWIVANDVSAAGGAMGGAHNRVWLLRKEGSESEEWPKMTKEEVARRLAREIAAFLTGPEHREAAE
ncbi:MAG: hypothetical protein D6757_00685, partial [Alphaproteobacteria bacterium]